MKKIVVLPIVSFFCTVLFLLSPVTSQADAQLDRIVAVVNDSVITQNQLDQQINWVKIQLQQSNAPMPGAAELRDKVLQNLIDEQLQLQIATKAGIKVSDTDLDQAIAHIAQQNNISVAVLQSKLAQQGMDFDQYRQQIRKQILLSQVQQQMVASRINISPQEVNDAIPLVSKQPVATANLVETHVRHILLKPTPLENDAQVQDRLARLRIQILNGADFAKLAEVNSQDPGSRVKGGDLGWVEPGMLDPTFEAQMNKLKPGETSEPFKTQFGWHILQVLGRQTMQTNDKDYLKAQASQLVYQRKIQEALKNWLQQLRSQAYIKIYP